MKKKTQIGCAGLAALVFILVVWFITIWMAPVDIVVPPRKYPPDNVYPVYKELARRTKALEDGDPQYKRGVELVADQLSSRPKNLTLNAEDKKAIAYVIAKFEPIRSEYIRLGNKPCVAVYDYDIHFPFPEFAQMRQWTRIESYLMQRHLKAGKRQEALQCYDNILRLSEQMNRGGMLLHSLVGIAMRAIIQVPVGHHLQDFSATECDRIVQISRRWLQYRFPMSGALEQEKYSGISMYHGLQSGNIRTDDLFPDTSTSIQVQFARLLNLRAAAREYDRYMNDLASEYRKPYLRQKSVPEPRHILNQIIAPVFAQAFVKEALMESIIRMTGCAAAVRAYKLRHGRYPKTLAEAGVQDLNQDPYTGGEFLYKTDPQKGFLIYSVGKDGQDNRGNRAPSNFEKPGTDVSPVYYRDPAGRSADVAPPGPPAWLK
jgi:hypothetical protein